MADTDGNNNNCVTADNLASMINIDKFNQMIDNTSKVANNFLTSYIQSQNEIPVKTVDLNLERYTQTALNKQREMIERHEKMMNELYKTCNLNFKDKITQQIFLKSGVNGDFLNKYFKENKANVEKYAQFQQNLHSGVGGSEKSSEYMVSEFPVRLGSKSAVLAKIPVKLEEYEFYNEFDGNLGQDLFMKFNTLIINFKYMYVDFE